MKEFILTQSYTSIDEMLNSDEMSVYKEELQTSEIKEYAIVSRIGNRYDLDGNKIEYFVNNPFYKTQEVEVCEEAKTIPVVCDIEEKNMEEEKMKYAEIEKLIDAEVEKAVAELKAEYEKEIEELKTFHENELATVKTNAKAEAKAEILAKLND